MNTEDKQTEDKKVRLARLVGENHVRFELNSTSEHWPASHAALYGEVRNLALVQFLQYEEAAQQDTEHASWKVRTSRQATLLVELVLECIQERQNEGGWRSKLEHHIFERFTYNPSCKSCGGRLWRAWRDPPETQHKLLAQDHEKRRANRKECQCLRSGQPLQQERTLSKLFSDRSGAYLVKDKILEEVHPRQGPDRVYGLKQSAETKAILSRKHVSKDPTGADNGKSLSEAFQTSPFEDTLGPLLFPFLVAEFKSEKAACGFTDIQNQTALPIRRLLRLQHRLRSAARTQQSKVLNPLVWFLAIRGDDVRVYGAHVDDEQPSVQYEVTCLLDCRISKLDGALQLLLLIDFIYEWARDIYRPMLVHQLKVLSGDEPDLISFHAGTNATTNRMYREEYPIKLNLSLGSTNPGPISAGDRLAKILNTKVGVVRNAQTVLYRARGVRFDEASTSIIFDKIASIQNARSRPRRDYDHSPPPPGEQRVRKLAKRIVDIFRQPVHGADDRFLANKRVLKDLQRTWLGRQGGRWDERLMGSLAEDKADLWVRLQYVTYLSHDWELVREISCVAITETALAAIVKLSGYKTAPKFAPEEIAPDTLERLLCKIRTSCVEHNLAAAKSRSMVGVAQAIRESDIAGLTENRGSIWDDDVKLTVGVPSFGHEVVLSVFEHLSTYRSSASDDFLWWEQKLETTETSSHVTAWPIDVPRLVQATPGGVLVRATGSSSLLEKQLKNQEKPDLCVFLLEETTDFGARLNHVLEAALLTWTIHHSWRRDTSSFQARSFDRNISEGFFSIFGGYFNDVRDQVEVAAMLGKWLELLDTPIKDELNIPNAQIQLTDDQLRDNRGSYSDYKQTRKEFTAQRKRWGECMEESVTKNREMHGFSAEEIELLAKVWPPRPQNIKADSADNHKDTMGNDSPILMGLTNNSTAALDEGNHDLIDLTIDTD